MNMSTELPTFAKLRNPQFRFRELDIQRILYCWRSGQSVLLTGIRRTGKSQIAKAALVRHGEAGRPIAFLDVQNYVSLASFYRDLLRELPAPILARLNAELGGIAAIPSRLTNWIRSQVKTVGVLETAEIEFQEAQESLPRYWQPIAEALERILANHPTDELPVLGIDELPFMLENLIVRDVPDAELTLTLASLRKLRDAGLRMIIAGSVSMENLLTLHKIPHTVLGGLTRHRVDPFSRAEAHTFLSERLQDTPGGNEEAINSALEILPDYVPEFLNIAEQHLRLLSQHQEVSAVLHNKVLPEIRRVFLTQFDERLTKNYSPDELPIIERILDCVAKAESGGAELQLSMAERSLVTKLQYDNFIMEGAGFGSVFTLNLLRQWWRATRGIS
jgi:hypothetical protein